MKQSLLAEVEPTASVVYQNTIRCVRHALGAENIGAMRTVVISPHPIPTYMPLSTTSAKNAANNNGLPLVYGYKIRTWTQSTLKNDYLVRILLTPHVWNTGNGGQWIDTTPQPKQIASYTSSLLVEDMTGTVLGSFSSSNPIASTSTQTGTQESTQLPIVIYRGPASRKGNPRWHMFNVQYKDRMDAINGMCDIHMAYILAEKNVCWNCDKITEKSRCCGRCTIARYCNIDCQSANWSFHSVNCVKE
jgi:hypothetical protein